MESTCDVLVIGAGAAGISACRDLTRAEVDVICVEARDRIGGRILTVVDPLLPLPVELGPEFIHGKPAEIWDLVHSGRLIAFDCAENAVHVVDGKVQKESDSWEQVGAITEVMKRVAAEGKDPTFLEFIQTANFPDDAKELATSYVEGFNAAHKEDVGVASLAFDATASDAISGDCNFRIASGYHAFLKMLLAGIDERAWQLRLSAVAQEVRWARDNAVVTVASTSGGTSDTITAKRVIITVPLGVLQAGGGAIGSIEFLPKPRRVLEAVDALRFGQVMRLVLRFTHAWWEENPDLADAGFWLSGEQYFPTWWTSLPVRSSMLVGWSSGPHCDELIGKSKDHIVDCALTDLAKVSNKPVDQLVRMLEATHLHDWQADPYSRGAYSYVPAGAMWAREQLAEPVEDTLFFAGEAAETHGHGATVHGAVASGRQAAQHVLRSLSK